MSTSFSIDDASLESKLQIFRKHIHMHKYIRTTAMLNQKPKIIVNYLPNTKKSSAEGARLAALMNL